MSQTLKDNLSFILICLLIFVAILAVAYILEKLLVKDRKKLGSTHFICGMALGCDMYCAEAVIELRKSFDDITLEAAVPYDGQEAKWSEQNCRRYRSILMQCDTTTLIQDTYTPGCMMRRNRYMVDNSNVLIACYNGSSGGTWNTVRYAMEKDIEIIQVEIEI